MRLLRWTILMLFSPFALALIFCVSGVIFLVAMWVGMSSFAQMFAKRHSSGPVSRRSRPGSTS